MVPSSASSWTPYAPRYTESQITVARAQFAPLPATDNIALNNLLASNSNPDEILHSSAYKLTRADLKLLVNHDYAAPIEVSRYKNIVNPYLEHVCDYVAVERSRTRSQTRNPEQRCAVLLNNFCAEVIKFGTGSRIVADRLVEAGCKGADMAKLDYIFIPILEIHHWALIGIAPKQRFIFLIDSAFWSSRHWQPETAAITSLVWQELAGTVSLESSHPWLIITPEYNAMNTAWKNRIWVRQKDEESCAILVCTNALCLAFGYPLLCYSNEPPSRSIIGNTVERNDIPNKRRRMAMELLQGGFLSATEEFRYDLLLVPDRFVGFQTQRDEGRVYKGFGVPPNSSTPPALPWFQKRILGKRRVGKARPVKASVPRSGSKKAFAGKGKRKNVGFEVEGDLCVAAREELEATRWELYKESQEDGTSFSGGPVYEGRDFPKQFPREFFEARVLFTDAMRQA